MNKVSSRYARQQGFIPVLVLIIIVIFGLVGYSVYRNYQNQQSNLVPTNTSSPDQTPNSKTYVDETLDISLKYPNSWTVGPMSSAGYSILISSPETPENNPGNGGASLSIDAIACGGIVCQTIDDYPGFSSIQVFDKEKMSNFETIQIGGTKALVFDYAKVFDNSLVGKPNEVVAQKVYLFNHNNMNFEVTYEEVDKDLNPVSDFSKWKYVDIRDQIIGSISFFLIN